MTATLAQELGTWVASCSMTSDPAWDAIVERAKLHFLDAIGVAFGGLRSQDNFAEGIRAVVGAYGSAPVAQLIGVPGRAAPALAAFHNGSLVHSVEFDDTFAERTVHTEAVTVPTVLAVGEAVGASGSDMVQAWCAGTEVMLRLAAGVDATFALNESGFHTTSVFGAYGAAAAAARLHRLDGPTTVDALALCTSVASGTNAGWGVGAARNKSIQPGWAAMAGILAVELARQGVRCAPTTIDSELGLYYSHAWRSGWSREPVTAGLGQEWKVLNGTFKFHAAGMMLQATLDCAAEIAARYSIRADDIESVRVLVPHQYTVLRTRPGFFDPFTPPDSAYGITANWPYAIAFVLCNGHLGLADLVDSAVFAEPVRAVAQQTEFVFSDDATVPPISQVTEVEIVTRHGTSSARRDRHSGYFADFSRVRAKFAGITSSLMPASATEAIVACVQNLDSTTSAELATAIAEGSAETASVAAHSAHGAH